ncbi:MAG: hypothetical protein HY370_06330 [Proteobacteria bacterium]|nr:hypothetical protein [Pseudomonadota bacterium]
MNVEKMLIGRLGWKHASGKTEEYLAATGLTKDRGISNALRVWAEATSSTLPRQARIVLDFLRKNAQGELCNRETGREITVDITGFPFQDDPRLAIVAYGEFARWLETSPDMSFNEAKEKLEMYVDGAFKPPRNIAGPEATP